ncbi:MULTISPECIES: IS110 family transposase [Nocardia]|uniref:IS110 family transposase n=1 Tax=Nocardia xishanensis TaxID=238964 RepID=A0ABW7X9Y6_9NOCA|nr:IS110 family transposase [Nocardia niwae]
MMVIGIDAHKRTHTAVSADELGRKLSTKTVGTTSTDHLALLKWARAQPDPERLWALEDCRNMTRRLESDLIAAGERVVRVPPKLMAHARDSARTYGKSDPIDALAIARAALREPDLPVARLDGVERELRLLVDHREDLVAERTRVIARLRWHLHELDPGWLPPGKLERASAYDRVAAHLAQFDEFVARLAMTLIHHCRRLTVEIDELAGEIGERVQQIAPSLLAIVGCAALTAAKIIGETAGVDRFRSKDAFARHNGSAPLPVWSSNRARHRLSRTGNRQLNAALHRIALTQARCHPGARALLAKRKAKGDGGMEALRILKRRLSDVVYHAMIADLDHRSAETPTAA